MTADEKLDLMLKYMKSARHWAIVRGVVSVIFFLIFIVFPAVGGVYLYRYFKTVDLSALKNIQAQFEDFKNFGAEFERLTGTLQGR